MYDTCELTFKFVLTWLQGCNQLVDVLPLLLARRNPSFRRPDQRQQPLLQLFFGRFQSIAILVGYVGAPKLRSMGTGRGPKQYNRRVTRHQGLSPMVYVLL